jgi:F-type H+-transporting ATPase subunit gamma
MIELERAQSRLENIRSVQPILGALHTISLGSWQAALNQRGRVQGYLERLEALSPLVVAHLPTKPPLSPPRACPERSRRLRGGWSRRGNAASTGGAKTAVLVIGSERGLCGRFNAAVVERAEAYLAEREANVELMTLGRRARRILERHGHHLTWAGALPITTLPSFDLARDLSRDWLARYEAHEVDAVDLIYNAYRGLGSYEPTVTRLIPPEPPLSPLRACPERRTAGARLWWGGVWSRRGNAASTGGGRGGEPSIIVETDPVSLFARVIEQLTATRLYELLLESTAAEHSTRYELMGAATQNADRLIAELTLAIQTARQQAITQEMQELAAGAGLIGTRNR